MVYTYNYKDDKVQLIYRSKLPKSYTIYLLMYHEEPPLEELVVDSFSNAMGNPEAVDYHFCYISDLSSFLEIRKSLTTSRLCYIRNKSTPFL